MKKTKILLMNSYSFEKIYDNWTKGVNPSHFLMGKVELDQMGDFEVTILKHEKFKWLNKIGASLKIPHLDQQIRALAVLRKFDVLYLPYPLSNSRLISFLKLAGLLSTPIVVLVHQNFVDQPNSKSIKNRLITKSNLIFDGYAFFSKKLMEKMKKDLRLDSKTTDKKFFHVNWGADTQFYKNIKKTASPNHEKFAVCAGTMDRDFDVVIEAFRGLDYKLKIYCTPSTVIKTNNIPINVTIDTSWVPYTQLLEEYAMSSFLLIPIKNEVKNRGNTYGLTVLLDALALGKPVLMTYHPFIDIDIEEEEIGRWIRFNDVSDWRENILNFINNDAQLETSGIKAKKLHVAKHNSNIFASEMSQIFKTVVKD